MFEPIDGSAPDIKGKGIANPIGAIWAVELMLKHLGYRELAEVVMKAMEGLLLEGQVLTPDLGGTAKTWEVGDAIVVRILQAK